MFNTSKAIAQYLIHEGLCPKVQTDDGEFRFLSIYAKNREEWIETDMGCILSAITVVTLYDTLGKDSIDYILNQTHIKTLACSADKIKTVLDLKKDGRIEKLTHIIYFDEVKPADKDLAQSVGVTLLDYATVCVQGEKMEAKFDLITPQTVYTLSYTSGTTGMPKGAMLMHQNFIANIASMERFDGVFKFQPDDVYISYLPLAHVFERFLMNVCMANQMQYGFY